MLRQIFDSLSSLPVSISIARKLSGSFIADTCAMFRKFSYSRAISGDTTSTISRLLAVPERKTGLPQALIMAPTRELSRQIHEEAQVLSRHTDITLLEVPDWRYLAYRLGSENVKHVIVEGVWALEG